jgi:hypothetical protein
MIKNPPLLYRYYYLNTRTNGMTWEKPEELGKWDLPTPRSYHVKYKSMLRGRKLTKVDAATQIQSSFRNYIIRKVISKKMRKNFVKILNDDAEDCRKYYYYSYNTGQFFWKKPFFLVGGDVLTKEEVITQAANRIIRFFRTTTNFKRLCKLNTIIFSTIFTKNVNAFACRIQNAFRRRNAMKVGLELHVQFLLRIKVRNNAACVLQRLAQRIKRNNLEKLVNAVLLIQKLVRKRIEVRRREAHERRLYEQTWKYRWEQLQSRCKAIVSKPTLALVYDGGGEIDQTFEKITISKMNMRKRYNSKQGGDGGIGEHILQYQQLMLQIIGRATIQRTLSTRMVMDMYGIYKDRQAMERFIQKRKLQELFLEDDLEAFKYSIISNQTILYRQGGIVDFRLTVGQEETIYFGREQTRLRNTQQAAFTMVPVDLSQNCFVANLQKIIPQHIFLWTLFGGGTNLFFF